MGTRVLKQAVCWGLMVGFLFGAGCRKQAVPLDEQTAAVSAPCPTGPAVDAHDANSDAMDVPRFAADSPFDVNYEGLDPQHEGKQLWARSFLWEEPPELIVEKWLSDPPDTEGKCVLIEFWATWCPPCRKSIPLLNRLHERFQDRLAVIGVSEESEATVRGYQKPALQYYSAIDTQQRTKNEMRVRGIPHIIILEPEGSVVWEGFPYQQGYELTEEIVGSILDIALPREPD